MYIHVACLACLYEWCLQLRILINTKLDYNVKIRETLIQKQCISALTLNQKYQAYQLLAALLAQMVTESEKLLCALDNTFTSVST